MFFELNFPQEYLEKKYVDHLEIFARAIKHFSVTIMYCYSTVLSLSTATVLVSSLHAFCANEMASGHACLPGSVWFCVS